MDSHEPSPDRRHDIASRTDIERLVNAFYDKVRADDLLGFIFDDVAKTDWAAHLPNMYAFWEGMVFPGSRFMGNPIGAHMRLVAQTAMGRPQFDRWLTIFTATVDELFAGENAGRIKNIAADMAKVIHATINRVPQEPFDYSKLTPQQRAHYASSKPKLVVP